MSFRRQEVRVRERPPRPSWFCPPTAIPSGSVKQGDRIFILCISFAGLRNAQLFAKTVISNSVCEGISKRSYRSNQQAELAFPLPVGGRYLTWEAQPLQRELKSVLLSALGRHNSRLLGWASGWFYSPRPPGSQPLGFSWIVSSSFGATIVFALSLYGDILLYLKINLKKKRLHIYHHFSSSVDPLKKCHACRHYAHMSHTLSHGATEVQASGCFAFLCQP